MCGDGGLSFVGDCADNQGGGQETHIILDVEDVNPNLMGGDLRNLITVSSVKKPVKEE